MPPRPVWETIPNSARWIIAFVVRGKGADVTAEELIAWSKKRMAGFKAPRTVEFLDALPLNATGKVMKDQLK
jgi:HIP---CoA ligase